MFKPTRIAVLAHPQVNEAASEAQQVAAFLEQKEIVVAHGSLYDQDLRQQVQENEFDLVIALGGDGTMLRAGHLCAPSGIPILGINMGRFGFLTEINRQDWKELLPGLIQGDFWLEKRMMLLCEQWHDQVLVSTWDVLNEVVVGRGEIVRPVHLITEVDDRQLTTYVADGLIVSTPTGSTAYALAAGGPILPPDLRNILLVPVAPHLSIDRGIVLAEGSSVRITVRTDHQAVMCVDGQAPISLQSGDQVFARAGDHIVQFIRFRDPGYFYRNLTPHMSQNPATSNQR